MKLLLDTHILLWAITDDPRLSEKARKLIQNPDNEIFYSIVSPWEVEINRLAHPDKMPIGGEALVKYCIESGYRRHTIREEHVFLLHTLRWEQAAPPHHDPFDRILICQCMADDMLFITHDTRLSGYNEPCVLTV